MEKAALPRAEMKRKWLTLGRPYIPGLTVKKMLKIIRREGMDESILSYSGYGGINIYISKPGEYNIEIMGEREPLREFRCLTEEKACNLALELLSGSPKMKTEQTVRKPRSAIVTKNEFGNVLSPEFTEYQNQLKNEHRCCFCGQPIPAGQEKRITGRKTGGYYDNHTEEWICCGACDKTAETNAEDLKKYLFYHVTAYRYLLTEKIYQRKDAEAAARKEQQEREEAIRRKKEWENRRQKAIDQMGPFLKKHAEAPDCAECILAYVRQDRELDCEYTYPPKMDVTEDSVRISNGGGAHSFFDDGGGESWGSEWKIWLISATDVPEIENPSYNSGSLPSVTSLGTAGQAFENPFGLSGIYRMSYRHYHEYYDD